MMTEDNNGIYLINDDFCTDFELDESSEPLLGIHNKNRVNRDLATQERIGRTSFSAQVLRVQYGTYLGDHACLVGLNFSFRFRTNVACRYSYAEIRVAFTRAIDIQNHKTRNTNPLDDPRVKNLAPKEVYGIVKTVEEKKVFDVTIPVMFESPIGLKAGVTSQVRNEKTEHQENRMEIHGHLYFDDDHDEDANAVTWDLSENDAQKDGIFREVKVAIVVLNPADKPMWMDVSVKPSVKFSADPRRLVAKNDAFARLLQKNDEPVLLDGKTPKTGQSDLGCSDFSSTTFPWDKVLRLPVEYAVSSFIVKRSFT
jgi:hypothetical protein